MSTFEFMNNPIMPGQPPAYTGYQQPQMVPQPMYYPVQQQPMYPQQMSAPIIQPPRTTFEGCGSFGFTIMPDEPENTSMVISSPVEIIEEPKKKRGRPVGSTNKKDIVKADGVVEDNSALYTYQQTTNMLHETVQQIDMLASEMKMELDNVRLSRTLRNKHNAMIGLSQGLATLLNSKISAISQINNSISKANDLDYKREKDRKASEANAAADDKYLMDLYSSFIRNPNGNAQQMMGPSMVNASLIGGNVPRTDIVKPDGVDNNGGIQDAGYLNYISNLTPEQNMMFYESDPNVKTVVVYDAASGNKFFQVMNVSTGQVIPNVTVLDNRFMEDTYIDVKNKIARNNNLHETYPVVIINESVVTEY